MAGLVEIGLGTIYRDGSSSLNPLYHSEYNDLPMLLKSDVSLVSIKFKVIYPADCRGSAVNGPIPCNNLRALEQSWEFRVSRPIFGRCGRCKPYDNFCLNSSYE
ncbi:hypothetical protein CBL_08196 [Carabus blaptoides fortunei]